MVHDGIRADHRAVGLTGYLLTVTHSTWDLLLYYPAKALWTAMVALIPLASAGAVTLLVGRGPRQDAVRNLSGSSFVAVQPWVLASSALASSAWVGFPPPPRDHRRRTCRYAQLGMALIDSMSKVPISSGTEDGALASGWFLSWTGRVRGGFVGMVDYMGMEALDHVGVNGAANAPIKVAIRDRDMTAICTYLQDHPRSLRISGRTPPLARSGSSTRVARRSSSIPTAGLS